METNPAAPGSQSETPSEPTTTSTGAMPTSQSATPAKPAEDETEKLRARIAELEKHAANKEDEAKRHAKKLKTYEEAEEAKRLADMSDIEKVNKRATDAEQRHQEAQATIKQYQQQLAVAHVKLAAQAKGIIDPEMAALAIQQRLEYGEDGMPTNVDKALDELIKNKPYLKKPETAAEPAPATPAQSAPTQRTPAIPAMNPGRTNIPAPNSTPPGQIPRLSDVYRQSRRQ